jgi:hypothetical protein
MASDAAIMEVGARLLAIGDYATACANKLARYPDADRDWLLSRPEHLEALVNELRKACEAAANE